MKRICARGVVAVLTVLTVVTVAAVQTCAAGEVPLSFELCSWGDAEIMLQIVWQVPDSASGKHECQFFFRPSMGQWQHQEVNHTVQSESRGLRSINRHEDPYTEAVGQATLSVEIMEDGSLDVRIEIDSTISKAGIVTKRNQVASVRADVCSPVSSRLQDGIEYELRWWKRDG
jgi:hypothetical protein